MRDYFYYLFGQRWPVQLFMLAGIVILILRWKRHPKVSLLAVTGLLLFLLQSVTFATVFYSLGKTAGQGLSYATVNYLFLLLAICRDIVYAGVIVLLVCAAFSGRKPPIIVQAN